MCVGVSMYNLTYFEMSLFKLTDCSVSHTPEIHILIDIKVFSLRVIVGAGRLSAFTNHEHVEFPELRLTVRCTASRRSPNSQHDTKRQLLNMVTRVNSNHGCHKRNAVAVCLRTV